MPLPFQIRLARKGATNHNASRLEDGTHAGSPALSPDGRLFALGTRTLADLIAPAAAEIRRDHLQLDAQYLRVIVVTGSPRTVAAGWLAPPVEEIELPLGVDL